MILDQIDEILSSRNQKEDSHDTASRDDGLRRSSTTVPPFNGSAKKELGGSIITNINNNINIFGGPPGNNSDIHEAIKEAKEIHKATQISLERIEEKIANS